MNRRLQCLAISLAGAAAALVGSSLLFPIQSAGLVSAGSAVYIGDGIILSNFHVFDFPGLQMAFWVPGWRYLDPTIEAPVRDVVYLDRDIELGVARLRPSLLSFAKVDTPCLSTRPLQRGEKLEVTSSPNRRFPPVSAAVVVSDARPLMRLDLDPSQPIEKRYSAMTIIATLSADQVGLVGHGSSGGPVLNRRGELVGLVWTGREIEGGSTEIWITPVSAWISHLQAADVSKAVLQAILDARCAE